MPFTGDLPDQGLNPCLVGLRASAGGFFSISATWEAQASLVPSKKKKVSVRVEYTPPPSLSNHLSFVVHI